MDQIPAKLNRAGAIRGMHVWQAATLRQIWCILTILWFSGAPSLATGSQVLILQVDSQRSQVGFKAHAPFHNFTGYTNRVSGSFRVRGTVEIAYLTGNIYVEAASLDTGNRDRDRDMREKFLEVHQYLQIRYEILDIQGNLAPVAQGQPYETKVRGTFHLHGVSRQVTVPVTATYRGGELRVQGKWKLDITDYRIRIPRVLVFSMDKVIEAFLDIVARALEDKVPH